ncbi:MAG: site-specific DNA-methyltransferase, partial [Alloprevotella sp.]
MDWNTTENLYIEGDNLEVLKLLQKSYLGKVKMIYIDPPYNTGNDFVYFDSFKIEDQDYELSAGNIDEQGNRLRKNTDTNARFHSDWCSMIYERLLVARSLLTEDGVIFISIDEKEIDNLKRLCNEVFGENNFLSIISRRTKTGGGSASHHFAIENDFICVYAKSVNKLPDMFAPFDEKYLKRYAFEDEIGKFFWDTMERSCTATVPYLIEAPDGTLLKGNWFRSEERFLKDK